MRKMIFYKEWLKTRWYLAAALAVMAAMTFYCLLNLSKTAQIRGGDMLWNLMILKETVLIEMLRYIPLVVGGLLAMFQFLPEMTRKRLKLTLHLPYPQGRMIAAMYGYGLGILLVLFLLQALCLGTVLRGWMAGELVGRILRTAAVWYLAGFAAYIWIAAVCLEPTWGMRVALLLLLAGLVHLLTLSSVPEAYNGILPWLCLYVLCGQLLIFHSVARFKEGLQD